MIGRGMGAGALDRQFAQESRTCPGVPGAGDPDWTGSCRKSPADSVKPSRNRRQSGGRVEDRGFAQDPVPRCESIEKPGISNDDPSMRCAGLWPLER
jgi:hypothetical protein